MVAQYYLPPSSQPVATAGALWQCYYAGDYDSAAWVYNKLLGLFDDGSGARGKTPIGWAVDPELSLRSQNRSRRFA